mgnify:CR=1 FL=1
MSIKRYLATKDNTISSAFKVNLSDRGVTSNMGSSDILEVFSIFGQASSSSLEQSRVLLSFPVNDIHLDRQNGIIPASGSVKFKMKIFNAQHNQTTPEKITFSAAPLVKDWNEGSGLDMETYMDIGPSSWHSASLNVAWANTGGDFLNSTYISSAPVPLEYTQFLETGLENLEIDVTSIVEQMLVNQEGNSVPASGSIIFNETNPPTSGTKFKLYGYNGDFKTFQFANTTGSSGNTIFVLTGSSAALSSGNLINAINSSSLSSSIAATGQGGDLTASLSQRVATFYGNTKISSSVPSVTASVTNFSGGQGALNYGFILKLSGSLEDGTKSKSYYTKKFFARSSHHQMDRPVIEVQWDSSIKDDRANIVRSSSLAPASDNLNNIYLYNKQRSGMVDIPSTGSNLLVQLVPSLGAAAVTPSGPSVSSTFITASKHSSGIYKATFAYSGSETKLYDIWQYTGSTSNGHVQLHTGSGFEVKPAGSETYYETPEYLTSITNLKSSYKKDEQATFRVYTRNKKWSPNIYTVATNTAPVNTIRDAYYKILRPSDNKTIIEYSTGSTPSYSSLSYDASGSYFDLDMSILEPNYLYEISFLYKDGLDFIEQKEKFKFRVDP